MDYAIHQDAGMAALSQFAAWGQHALVSEARPPVYKDWTQSVPSPRRSVGSDASLRNARGEITTVDLAETTPVSVAAPEHVAGRDEAARSFGSTSDVARKRSRFLAVRYALGDQVPAEIEARLEILSAQLEKLSPRVLPSQVERLEQVAAEAASIASRRNDRANRLAALLAQ